jgi:hypothetical protein
MGDPPYVAGHRLAKRVRAPLEFGEESQVHVRTGEVYGQRARRGALESQAFGQRLAEVPVSAASEKKDAREQVITEAA